MSSEEILTFLERCKTLKIAVIGDFILDCYVNGDVERISPEAPVVILNKTTKTYSPGGAGNVVMNLRNLGVVAPLFTIANIKYKEYEPIETYAHQGNTPIKTRVMSGTHHLLRVDEDDGNDPVEYDDLLWKEDIEKLIPQLDCLVFSDYSKGTISPRIAAIIIGLCIDNFVPVVVDTKKNFPWYKYASIVKCNNKEWRHNPFHVDEYLTECSIFYLVITCGGHGIKWHTKEVDGEVVGMNVPVADVCGAGDTVTAILAVCEALSITINQACDLANRAAAETCKHPGVYPITREDMLAW